MLKLNVLIGIWLTILDVFYQQYVSVATPQQSPLLAIGGPEAHWELKRNEQINRFFIYDASSGSSQT